GQDHLVADRIWFYQRLPGDGRPFRFNITVYFRGIMKHCPNCQRTYPDASLNFCRVDGTRLVEASPEEPTRLIGTARVSAEAFTTRVLPESSTRVTASYPPVTKYAKSCDVTL